MRSLLRRLWNSPQPADPADVPAAPVLEDDRPTADVSPAVAELEALLREHGAGTAVLLRRLAAGSGS